MGFWALSASLCVLWVMLTRFFHRLMLFNHVIPANLCVRKWLIFVSCDKRCSPASQANSENITIREICADTCMKNTLKPLLWYVSRHLWGKILEQRCAMIDFYMYPGFTSTRDDQTKSLGRVSLHTIFPYFLEQNSIVDFICYAW